MSCARSFWPAPDPHTAPTRTAAGASAPEPSETCEVCGAAQLVWRKCKLVCLNCGTILKSCADL